MPNLSGAGAGALTGFGIGSTFGGPIGGAIGAGIGGIAGLFKKKKKKEPEQNPETADVNQLRESAAGNRAEGEQLGAQGQEAITPALGYYKDILSADPSAAMEATRGQRGRVIDQYDAARQAAAKFGARGGGTNAAIAESYFTQAEQLNDITSAAKSDAASQLGQLGQSLTGLGLSADQLASADINTVIQAVLGRESLKLQKSGQKMSLFGDLGQAAGSIIGAVMTKGK